MERFVDDNISASVDLEVFINCIESFDEISMRTKNKFGVEHETKMRLCSEAMETVTNMEEAIMKFKHTNELGDNGEVDNLL